MATCRLCKKYDDESRMVKYGTRHYAHGRCYLASGKSIDRLHDWQIRNLPAMALREFGYLDHPRVVAVTKQIDREIEASQAEAEAILASAEAK